MDTRISRRQALKLAGAGALAAATGTARANESQRAALELLGIYGGGRYTLPELPYAYDALEPLYEAKALQIHHQRHHAGYVKGLNAVLERLHAARSGGDYAAIRALSRDLAFYGSGHVLHSLFWSSMTPSGVAETPEKLAAAMNADFGSVEAAKAQFSAAAKAVEASGWAILAYEPAGCKLLILQAQNHQDLAIWTVVPLLVCDVWEHAYYLQYANDRGQWVDAFMKLANWDFAARRYAAR